MTYLDSNVLIRIITGDSPAAAEDLLKRIEQGKKNEFLLEPAVIAEVCFVLEFHDYAMPRAVIGEALMDFLSAPQVNSSENLELAVTLYKKNKKIDFTDCWLLTLARANKFSVLTLDKDLNKKLTTRS